MLMIRRLWTFLCTLLKLPSPKDLGWSSSNSLGSRSFTPFQEGKTGEDWTEYVKEHHTVKYFLVETVPSFFWPIYRKSNRVWYWLKCHILPSYRFHKLDLRGVDPLSDYTHGYMDPCEVIRLATWSALRTYIEKEQPHDPATSLTPEELAQEWHAEQKRLRYDEPMALYKYWMEERLAEDKEEKRLFAASRINKKNALNKEEYQDATKEWLDFHTAQEAREQEMFLKVCALREYLWT